LVADELDQEWVSLGGGDHRLERWRCERAAGVEYGFAQSLAHGVLLDSL
jgi:hypothetical protein